MPDVFEKLMRREDGFPRTGTGWIDAAGNGEIKMHPAPQVLVNPDGPEAVAKLKPVVEALRECQDKLWVIHFGLKDEAEREAAINAVNMASAALKGLNPS